MLTLGNIRIRICIDSRVVVMEGLPRPGWLTGRDSSGCNKITPTWLILTGDTPLL